MKCSVCKTFGHNKKGCPTLKNVVAGTSVASAAGNAATSDFTNAAIGSQSSVNADPSAGLSAGCTPSASSSAGCTPTAGPSVGCTPSDVRQLSTQQSTYSAASQKTKTGTTLRGGATLAYKKPRPKKSKDSWLWSLIWIRWQCS